MFVEVAEGIHHENMFVEIQFISLVLYDNLQTDDNLWAIGSTRTLAVDWLRPSASDDLSLLDL